MEAGYLPSKPQQYYEGRIRVKTAAPTRSHIPFLYRRISIVTSERTTLTRMHVAIGT